MLTAWIIHSILIRQRSIRGKTKLTLHPPDYRRQCHTGRIPIRFAEQDAQFASKPAFGVCRCTMTPTNLHTWDQPS
jgi:hypothetical protein